ncbi:unnamed protein product [Rotaria sp. Silwood2]|nr:unnamed protein product [Rotaria sp. Silwood2]
MKRVWTRFRRVVIQKMFTWDSVILKELLAHHILINKDCFDKIKKQLSNSDSQVSSIPPVIQLSPPSSSTVITISEP